MVGEKKFRGRWWVVFVGDGCFRGRWWEFVGDGGCFVRLDRLFVRLDRLFVRLGARFHAVFSCFCAAPGLKTLWASLYAGIVKNPSLFLFFPLSSSFPFLSPFPLFFPLSPYHLPMAVYKVCSVGGQTFSSPRCLTIAHGGFSCGL